MKLLLTSGGLTNDSIANALFELVGKKPEDTKVVFIPTANSDYFKNFRENIITKIAEGMSDTIYAVDDQSALKVVNGVVEVVSEGTWFALSG